MPLATAPSLAVDDAVGTNPLPSPLDDEAWEKVIGELRLAPQQERMVRLIMLAKGDKEIAAEMGIRFGTIRTYLSRVFARVGVEDRTQLIHRVYAVAIADWAKRHCPAG